MKNTGALLSKMLSHADPAQVAGLSRFFKTGPGQYGEGAQDDVEICHRKITGRRTEIVPLPVIFFRYL